MPQKVRAINKRTQNPQALWRRKFEALWNLGILKGSELGVCLWLIWESQHGESSKAWDWNTTQDLPAADQKGGLPGKLHRSILGRHSLVLVVFPSICVPGRALSPAQLSEWGIVLVVRMLTWLLWKEGQCPATGGEVGSQRLSRTNSDTFYLCNDFSVESALRVLPSREDTPNVTAAFLFLPQISLGLSGKGRVRANSVIVSFHHKQQRQNTAISYFRHKNNFLPALACTTNSLTYSKSHFCYFPVKLSWSPSSHYNLIKRAVAKFHHMQLPDAITAVGSLKARFLHVLERSFISDESCHLCHRYCCNAWWYYSFSSTTIY